MCWQQLSSSNTLEDGLSLAESYAAVTRPDGTVSCLAIGLGLRLFMEMCMCTTIAIFGAEMGESAGFQQMLIVEHIIEHTQIPVLLAAILFNPEYSGVLRQQLAFIEQFWQTE